MKTTSQLSPNLDQNSVYVVMRLSKIRNPLKIHTFSILGKDEVGGSNPPNSSKNLENVMFSRLFVFAPESPEQERIVPIRGVHICIYSS